jgi:hypothetical protein
MKGDLDNPILDLKKKFKVELVNLVSQSIIRSKSY